MELDMVEKSDVIEGQASADRPDDRPGDPLPRPQASIRMVVPRVLMGWTAFPQG